MIAAGRVLHLVPPNGGGVDRFVRDLCSRRPADWVLHVSVDQCVVEHPGQGLFIPVASDGLADLVAKGVLGRPMALHAHSTVRPVRESTRMLAATWGLQWVLTLHDVQAAGRDPELVPDELEQRLDFIRAAAHRTVPSEFMRDVAGRILGGSSSCIVIDNGVDAMPAAAAASTTGETFQIAVVGAMGPHKGLAHLVDVADRLPAGARIVLLGYADGQLGSGWLVPGRIWVHGVFEPAQLPQLVADYGCTLAFFPKGQPESYCYAMSDAWLAGLPVIGPDQGAIGERLAAHGGGIAYGVDASPAEVASIIAGQLQRPASLRAGVSAAVQGLASIATMVDTMNELYAGVAGPEVAPDLAALQQAAAKHLDSRFFRQELLRLQGDFAAAALQRDNALAELATLAENFGNRGAWIEQLQRDQASLRASCDSIQQQMQQQQESIAGIELARAQLAMEHAQLQQAHRTLEWTYDTLVRRLTWPLRLLPSSWQKWIRKTGRRVLVGGENNG